MSHEGANVFDLPAPGAVALYFSCQNDGRQDLIWKLHGFKLAQRQADQLFSQVP